MTGVTLISLPVGSVRKLESSNPNARWVSDNLNVRVRNIGGGKAVITADRDWLRPHGQATVSAVVGVDDVVESVDVTIVPWPAGIQVFDPIENVGNYSNVIEVEDGTLYALSGKYVYKSNDALETVELVGEANISPSYNNPILQTPLGYFCREDGAVGAIYRSDDLLNWELCYTPKIRCLYHGFDYYWDGSRVIIYTGEYDTEPANRHRVYRGIVYPDGSQEWSVILEFYSPDEHNTDPTLLPTARHIHLVQVDPYTGDVWVGTGDTARQCHLYRSSDAGETWQVIGGGNDTTHEESQKWRSLAMWYTEKYVYWNNDITTTQHIWRIKRTDLDSQSVENDLSEIVTTLDNGSHWYRCWAVDEMGRDVVVMGMSAEGQRRDWLGRVFSLYERPDGSVEVNELLSFKSDRPDEYRPFTQLEPRMQDSRGNVYLYGRMVEPPGMWRARFSRPFRMPDVRWAGPTSFVNPID